MLFFMCNRSPSRTSDEHTPKASEDDRPSDGEPPGRTIRSLSINVYASERAGDHKAQCSCRKQPTSQGGRARAGIATEARSLRHHPAGIWEQRRLCRKSLSDGPQTGGERSLLHLPRVGYGNSSNGDAAPICRVRLQCQAAAKQNAAWHGIPLSLIVRPGPLRSSKMAHPGS